MSSSMEISDFSLLCAVVVLFIPVILLLFFKRSLAATAAELGGRSRVPIPCPGRLPVIGNLHQIGPHYHRSFHELSLRFGPLMSLRLGSVQAIVVSSADIAREIFKSHDAAFAGRPASLALSKLTYNRLAMSAAPYGEYWRQVRKLCVVELLGARLVAAFRRIREEEVLAAIRTISDSAPPVAVNLSGVLKSMTNRIVWRAAFGAAGRQDQDVRFNEILAETQRMLAETFVGDYIPWLRWLDELRGLQGRLEKNFRELDEYYETVINDHIGRAREKSEDHLVDEDLIDVLLRLHRDPAHENIFPTKDHIKGIISDIFVAGTDTSSATLEWAMTLLVKNPEAMARVQEEVRSRAGGRGGMVVEESELGQLPYLKLVVKETMRLRPPAPLLVPHETMETCTVEESGRGYLVPAGTRVFVNLTSIAMDAKVWENPEEFRPERFLNVEEVDFRGRDCRFAPFGAGRRICPGIDFAIPVVELALANLLCCFDWAPPAGMRKEEVDMEEDLGITVHRKNPLHLAATKAMHLT